MIRLHGNTRLSAVFSAKTAVGGLWLAGGVVRGEKLS